MSATPSTLVQPSPTQSRGVCYANPFVQWLLGTGWAITDIAELVRRLGAHLVAEGIPLRELILFMHSAHPQVEGASFTWRRDTADVETGPIPRGLGQAGAKPEPGHPIIKRLEAQGATSYVTVPTALSEGATSAVAFVGDRAGGFSACELEQFEQLGAALARLLEAHSVRRTAQKLLQTYLGKRTGEQVPKGRIERGAGQDIHAVIGFCDGTARGSLQGSESVDIDFGCIQTVFPRPTGLARPSHVARHRHTRRSLHVPRRVMGAALFLSARFAANGRSYGG